MAGNLHFKDLAFVKAKLIGPGLVQMSPASSNNRATFACLVILNKCLRCLFCQNRYSCECLEAPSSQFIRAKDLLESKLNLVELICITGIVNIHMMSQKPSSFIFTVVRYTTPIKNYTCYVLTGTACWLFTTGILLSLKPRETWALVVTQQSNTSLSLREKYNKYKSPTAETCLMSAGDLLTCPLYKQQSGPSRVLILPDCVGQKFACMCATGFKSR